MIELGLVFKDFSKLNTIPRYSSKKKNLTTNLHKIFFSIKICNFMHLQKLLIKPVFTLDNQLVGQTSSNEISNNLFSF